MSTQNRPLPQQASDLQTQIIGIHDELVKLYDKSLAQQHGSFDEGGIRSFIMKCCSRLEQLGCCSIVYEREKIVDVEVMSEAHALRIVAPENHKATDVDDWAYTNYREGVSKLFDGKGNMFRLRKITNPGKSSGIGGPVHGAYCMPFWIRKTSRKESDPDLFTLLLRQHYERNSEVHGLQWSDAEIATRVTECQDKFQELLFQLYMPDSRDELYNIFYYPSYDKECLESHMMFAFTGIKPGTYSLLERICSRIAYLIRKATAEDLTYKLSAGSVAARTMCRNFAHNFGSHALFYVSLDSARMRAEVIRPAEEITNLMTRLQQGEVFATAELIPLLNEAALATGRRYKSLRVDHHNLLDLVDFVRDRGTYQAQVGSNTSSFWTLNLDLIPHLERFRELQLLTRNLCRSELGTDGLDIRIENLTNDSKVIAALSMGRVGFQALYSIIENIAKNTAKYANRDRSEKLAISVFLEGDDEFPDDHRISIESNWAQDQNVVNALREYLDGINFGNRRSEYERLGLAEIVVSASFLRRITPDLIKPYLKQSSPASPDKPPLLKISISDRAGYTNGSIRYTFFIPKPNLALIISDSQDVQERCQELGEAVAVKNLRDFNDLVAGFKPRIPRHDFLIIDSALIKDSASTESGENVSRKKLTGYAAYLPSRWVFLNEAEMLGWFKDAGIGTGQADLQYFTRLVWDRYIGGTPRIADTYIIDSRFEASDSDSNLDTVIALPSYRPTGSQSESTRRVVLSGKGREVPAGSIIFLHEYAERRRHFTQNHVGGATRGGSNGIYTPKAQQQRFVEAIRNGKWTESMRDEVLRISQRGSMLVNSSELDDATLLALYPCIEAANAHIVVIDERIDEEMSQMTITSKDGAEEFDDYWAQRNVFRILHQEFVDKGHLKLLEYQNMCSHSNKPKFVFIHLSLIQRWKVEHSGEEDRFRKLAARWSRAGIKLIIHSDRGNHDLTEKWKAASATFDSLGAALIAGDKMQLVELALAARAPRERI